MTWIEKNNEWLLGDYCVWKGSGKWYHAMLRTNWSVDLVERHLYQLQGHRAFDVEATAKIFVGRCQDRRISILELVDWMWEIGPEIGFYDWERWK